MADSRTTAWPNWQSSHPPAREVEPVETAWPVRFALFTSWIAPATTADGFGR